MRGKELAVAHLVFGIGGCVNYFHDIAFGDQSGIHCFGALKVPGKVESAGDVEGTPKVKAKFVVEGRVCHVS